MFGSARACGNKTKDPTGLCPQHKKSMPLHDINAGTGKPPLMTALPRVGPPITTSYEYTVDEPESNAETANMLVDQVADDSVDAALYMERNSTSPGRRGSSGSYLKLLAEDIIGFAALNTQFSFPDFTSEDRIDIKIAKERFRAAKSDIPFGPNRARMIEAAEKKIIDTMPTHLKEKYSKKGL
jgi:hypothetical protein